MSDKESKRQKIYDLGNAEIKPPPQKMEIRGVSLWPPSTPALNTLITLYRAF